MNHAAPGRIPIACTGDGCRVCQLTDPASPHYREGYRRMFFPAEFPDAPTSSPCPEPSPLPPSAEPARPTVPEALAIIARMKACPHWVASSDCGCGNNRCSAGKGKDGVVSHADCAACLGGAGNS